MKIILALFLVLAGPTYGQITGKITTAANKPIANASIQLLQVTDSSLLKTTVTDSTGLYRFTTIAPGKYLLRVSSIGYNTHVLPAFDLQTAINLGELVLVESQRELQEVTVRANKPVFQQSPEGITVNVESSVLSKGSSAMDILVRSPGIAIDYRNNDIALNGRSGVQVMINGRLQRMSMQQLFQLLNGMNGNDIEKIELLTTPSVQYDAEGSAGIINIVMKKNKRAGTNGSFTLTGSYGWGPKATASTNFSHNTNKLNLYGSYSYLYDRAYSQVFIDSWQNMPVLGGDLNVIVQNYTRATQQTHDASAGFDLKLNNKTTTGATVSFSNSTRSSDDHNYLQYIILPDSLNVFRGVITGTNHWKNLMSSYYIDKEFRAGEKLRFNVDYYRFSNNSPTNINSSFTDDKGEQAGNNDSLFAPYQRGFATTNIQVGVAKLDYTRQLSTKWKMEAGLKGTYTTSRSESGIESLLNTGWTKRTETIDNVTMKESIAAGYALVTAQPNISNTLTMGLRYEYAHGDMKDPVTNNVLVQRRQGVFFPGITWSRKLNEHSELQLSWTKRISRPSYNDLASFVRYADPSAVMTGNPLLKPTITNNIKLGWNYNQYTFSLLFSRDENPIARYMLTESPQRNLLYVSPQNLDWQRNLSLQANLPITVTNWWNMNYSLTGSWRQYRIVHIKEPATYSYVGLNANATYTFTLPKRYSVELSGWFNTTAYSATVKIGAVGAMNAGVKKELKKNGGTLQLSAVNLLRTMQFHTWFGAVAVEAFDIKNYVAFDAEAQKYTIIKLSYTRSFGTALANVFKKQGGDNNEERDRIRKE